MKSSIRHNKQSQGTFIGVENGLFFRGANPDTYGNIPHSLTYGLSKANAFSASAVIQLPKQGVGGTYHGIIYKRNITYPYGGIGFYIIRVSTNNYTLGFVLTDTTDKEVTYSFNAPEGALRHVGFSYNPNGESCLYIGGIQVAKQTLTVNEFSNTANINIGHWYGFHTNIAYTSGFISNVCLFNKTLTVGEFSSMMGEIGLVPKQLHQYVVGHWTCNQKYGKTLWDSVKQYNYTRDEPNMLISTFGSTSGWIIPSGFTFDTTAKTARFYNPSIGPKVILRGTFLFPRYDINRTYKLSIDVTNYVAGEFTIALGSRAQSPPFYGNGTHTFTVTNTEYISGGGFEFRVLVGGTGSITGPADITFSNPRTEPISHPLHVANHGTIINYTDAEAGITDIGNQTAWVDHYTKKVETGFSRKFVDDTDRITTDTTTIPLDSLVNKSLTIEFWAKRAATTTGLAFSFGQTYQNNRCPHVKFGDSTINWDFWNNANSVSYSKISEWNHYAFVYDHTNLKKKIYINGVLSLDVDTVALNLGTSDALTIGGWGVNANEFFNGYINNFRIWDTVRTAQQIGANMNKLIGAATTNLFLEWGNSETVNGFIKDYAGTRTGTRGGSSTDIVEFRSLTEPIGALAIGASTKGVYVGAGAGLEDTQLRDLLSTQNYSITIQFIVKNTGAKYRHYLLWAPEDATGSGLEIVLSTDTGDLTSPPILDISKIGSTRNKYSLAGRYDVINTLTITRDGSSFYLYLNEVRYSLSNMGSMNANIRWYQFFMTQVTNFEVYALGTYIFNRTVSFREHLNIHGGGSINRPINRANMLIGVDYNSILPNNKLANLAPNTKQISISGYSTAETTVGDPSYAIKTINSLR